MEWTILEILRWTTGYFREKGIQAPRLTAETLLAYILQRDRMYLYVNYDQPLQTEERERFKPLIRQRVQGVPTQYLTGRQEFWSLDFEVTPAVLIPRPESEHLVEAALKLATQWPQPRILDIGTGSGILAVSLKKELPQAAVYAGDLSEAALLVAQQNAERLLSDKPGIDFRQGDLLQPFAGLTFDLIISNPPYVTETDYRALAREIREHEPSLALLAGPDGLDVYRRLIPQARAALNPDGRLLIEIGCGQQDAVGALLQQHGLRLQQVINDYAGIERVLVACLRSD
jgi:release factor glutamine methyltransferase